MTDPQPRATSYLAPTVDAFWRWSADGEVLTWMDGKTIAFRPEVQAVLTRIAPHGLPPFGAVAMLLAACREGWSESGGREVVRGYTRVFDQWRAGAAAGGSTRSPLHATQIIFARTAREVGKVLEGL